MAKKKIFKKIAVADFETTGHKYYKLNKCTKVYAAGISTLAGVHHQFYNLKEFIDFIFSQKIELIFFHNLKFDFEFIKNYVVENNLEFEIVQNEFKRIIYATITKDNHSIQFRDSLLIFNSKLKELAISFNLSEKIEEDKTFYDKEEYEITNELKEYLHRDCEILRGLINYYLLELKQQGIFDKLPLSASSYSKQVFLNAIGQERYNRIFNFPSDLDKELRPFYYGGYCYLNPNYANIKLNNITSVDINSFYPSIMHSDYLPFGNNVKIEDGYYTNDLKRILYIVKLDGYLKEGERPYLLYKSFRSKKNNYIEDTEGEITVGIWDFELEYVKSKYTFNYFKIIKSYVFNRSNTIFKEYIQKLYELKATSKGAKRQFIKILLNSLYGKFGQNVVATTVKTINFNKDTLRDVDLLEEVHFKSYLPLAMCVTAMARFKLNQYIDLFKDNFIYCDTDSIYFKDDNLKLSSINLSNKLGDFKIEHKQDTAIFIKQKTYIIGKDVKVAGAGTASSLINFENFKKGAIFLGANLKLKRVPGGYILYPLNFKID